MLITLVIYLLDSQDREVHMDLRQGDFLIYLLYPWGQQNDDIELMVLFKPNKNYNNWDKETMKKKRYLM